MPVLPESTEPEGPARRVLVVDDEPAIRELLSMICAYEGWDVRTAEAGVPALRAVEEQPPDVVLLDMMLPDVDGLTVLRALRASFPALPVIIVSARDSVQDRAALLAAGAAGHVTKPFAVAALTDEVRRAFAGTSAGTAAPRG